LVREKAQRLQQEKEHDILLSRRSNEEAQMALRADAERASARKMRQQEDYRRQLASQAHRQHAQSAEYAPSPLQRGNTPSCGQVESNNNNNNNSNNDNAEYQEMVRLTESAQKEKRESYARVLEVQIAEKKQRDKQQHERMLSGVAANDPTSPSAAGTSLPIGSSQREEHRRRVGATTAYRQQLQQQLAEREAARQAQNAQAQSRASDAATSLSAHSKEEEDRLRSQYFAQQQQQRSQLEREWKSAIEVRAKRAQHAVQEEKERDRALLQESELSRREQLVTQAQERANRQRALATSLLSQMEERKVRESKLRNLRAGQGTPSGASPDTQAKQASERLRRLLIECGKCHRDLPPARFSSSPYKFPFPRNDV
jgi:hypothetical protein